MKKALLLSLLVLFAVNARAQQWTTDAYGLTTSSNVGIGNSVHPGTRLRLSNPPVATETPGSGGQLAFGVPEGQYWMFRMNAANSFFLDRFYPNTGWVNAMTLDHAGPITMNAIAGIGVTPYESTRLRLSNPPVATETPGSGGQLAFGTTTGQNWMFRLDANSNLHLDRCCWGNGLSLTPAGFVGVNTVPTQMLDVYNTGNSFIQTRGGYAGLLLTSGNGTTSTRYSFIDMRSSETQPAVWRVGMNGSQDFTITDFVAPYPVRVALTRAGDFTVYGNISATGSINARYQDVAEWVSAKETMPPGTVVVIDPDTDDGVVPSSRAYDTRVAGVVSARPGVLLGEAAPSKEKVATTGRVIVRVDATRGAVRRGDLLVCSDKRGVAMKSEPVLVGGVEMHRPGTVIGKALEPLASGEGEILVLLSLQ